MVTILAKHVVWAEGTSFQSFLFRDLTVTYKAQFRSWQRHQTEDIHACFEALHCLAAMAWPFMDNIREI